ncbi:MAG: GNAT family N-acetyltransferase [Rhodocyclaceae bacterium]|nr:GNAT family N-acetyltransferase [Rhodocyclaceae bacterium]
MSDMLVRLYDLPALAPALAEPALADVRIKRPLALDIRPILQAVTAAFGASAPGWADECHACLLRQPATCFVAERDGQLVGFACYDATARGMFGPVGVIGPARGKGIGRALLLHCLHAMAADGYAYAVIGWVNDPAYYQAAVGAVLIEGSEPGVYRRRLGA